MFSPAWSLTPSDPGSLPSPSTANSSKLIRSWGYLQPDAARDRSGKTACADARIREARARYRCAGDLSVVALPHRPASQLCQRLEDRPEPLCEPGSGDDLARQAGGVKEVKRRPAEGCAPQPGLTSGRDRTGRHPGPPED